MIIPLIKLTIYGELKAKERILADLQNFGCLHLIPLAPQEERLHERGYSAEARETLKFLVNCPQRRRQVRDPTRFDPAVVEAQAGELQRRIQALADERDFLRGRINDLKPWGEFRLPPPEELGNLQLWFYVVPHYMLKKIKLHDLIWEIVGRDNRFTYMILIAEQEPPGMPVLPVQTGDQPLSELESRLEEVELELEDLQAERASLTRWIYLFDRSLHRLEDLAVRREAAQQTFDHTPVFALQAWAPRENQEELQNYAQKTGLVLEIAEPEMGETPPTLLRNPPTLTSGQDLVSFYTTPGYWVWDPSTIVFFSFALFFAMIIADAGYGLIMGLGLALGYRRLGQSDPGRRIRILLATLVGATLLYGILVGSYFGLAPPHGGILARARILTLNNFDAMMMLVIMVGIIHLVTANLVEVWRRRRSAQALAPLGWVLIFLGAFSVYLSLSARGPAMILKTAGVAALGLGGVGVLLFSQLEGGLNHRILGGLKELTRLSSAFGDTLSYLRLFALGLASASLATTFNSLAGQIHASVRGLGMLLALLIILLGHGLNLLLAISSGVIHGLRLNFIEFFNWSMSGEGYPFKAFARKEKVSWRK